MNRKIIISGVLGIIFLSSLIFGYLFIKNQKEDNEEKSLETTEISETSGPCIPSSISLQGYSEQGKKLANCFVQYPGEPSRTDTSYYIVENICGQFTQEFVENASGLKFVQITKPIISSLYNCTYFTKTSDGLTGDYILLQLEYLNAQNQKDGHEFLGRTVSENSEISIENYVVYQEDGLINSILLILNENKYIRVDRTSRIKDTTLLNTAINIAKSIKNYK